MNEPQKIIIGNPIPKTFDFSKLDFLHEIKFEVNLLDICGSIDLTELTGDLIVFDSEGNNIHIVPIAGTEILIK